MRSDRTRGKLSGPGKARRRIRVRGVSCGSLAIADPGQRPQDDDDHGDDEKDLAGKASDLLGPLPGTNERLSYLGHDRPRGVNLAKGLVASQIWDVNGMRS